MEIDRLRDNISIIMFNTYSVKPVVAVWIMFLMIYTSSGMHLANTVSDAATKLKQRELVVPPDNIKPTDTTLVNTDTKAASEGQQTTEEQETYQSTGWLSNDISGVILPNSAEHIADDTKVQDVNGQEQSGHSDSAFKPDTPKVLASTQKINEHLTENNGSGHEQTTKQGSVTSTTTDVSHVSHNVILASHSDIEPNPSTDKSPDTSDPDTGTSDGGPPFKVVEKNGYVYYYYEDGQLDDSDVVDVPDVAGDIETTSQNTDTHVTSETGNQSTESAVDATSHANKDVATDVTTLPFTSLKPIPTVNHHSTDIPKNTSLVNTNNPSTLDTTKKPIENTFDKLGIHNSGNVGATEKKTGANNSVSHVAGVNTQTSINTNQVTGAGTHAATDNTHVVTAPTEHDQTTPDHQGADGTIDIPETTGGSAEYPENEDGYNYYYDDTYGDDDTDTTTGTDSSEPGTTESSMSGHNHVLDHLHIPEEIEKLVLESDHDGHTTSRVPIITTTMKPITPSDVATARPKVGISGQDMPSFVFSSNASSSKDVDAEIDAQVDAIRRANEDLVREPEDVEPLNIFVGDIMYQRFPRPMSLQKMRENVCTCTIYI